VKLARWPAQFFKVFHKADIRDCDGPSLHVIKVSDNPYHRSLPQRDGVHLKNRFREALLGPDAIE